MLRTCLLQRQSFNTLNRLSSKYLGSFDDLKHRIAIVGSGPSGFYSAKYLLDQNKDIQVDMYEKLPTPFGLVRFGVAPDHPEVKSVGEQFCDVADSNRFRYFGNVKIGGSKNSADVCIFDMIKSYSGVILAYGAGSDIGLNITGETLKGVHSARHFVNWYNGHPEVPPSDDVTFDLSNVQHVVVVGQGNVALDCARILTQDPSILAVTDISRTALEVLKRSAVKTVSVVGRRGHVQSSFTIKEFRELTKLNGVHVKVREDDIQAGLTDSTNAELQNNRPKKRIVELIQSVAKTTTSEGEVAQKVVDFRFLSSPTGFVDGSSAGDQSQQQRVTGMTVQRNRLEGEPFHQRAVSTSESVEVLPCELVLKSVGYKCEPISDDLPFDSRTNTMPHFHGRVLDTLMGAKRFDTHAIQAVSGESVSAVRGMYVTGWLKRGPSGIIGTNIPDAKETVASVLTDLDEQQRVLDPSASLTGHVRDVVDWKGFLRIDAEERRRGANCTPPREREKILSVEEMVRVARDAASER